MTVTLAAGSSSKLAQGRWASMPNLDQGPAGDDHRPAGRRTSEIDTIDVIGSIVAISRLADLNNNDTLISGHDKEIKGDKMSEEALLRELSDMRSLLERLIEHRADACIDNLMDMLVKSYVADSGLGVRDVISETVPEATGESKATLTMSDQLLECGICLETVPLTRRPCCQFAACDQCLTTYLGSRVQLHQLTIPCLNGDCDKFVHRQEIGQRLDHPMRDSYLRLLVESNSNGLAKTCPKCNAIYQLTGQGDLNAMMVKTGSDRNYSRVQCQACNYYWCFVCHAPWHGQVSCKQYSKGDRLLSTWAKELSQGQLNAQKCPKCKIFIQRSTGCDHMHCIKCQTDFCYRCGDRLRRLKFFGDHYSKLSVFGCKFRYRADQPIKRKAIRGTVFASKLCLAPILGSLAVCAGALIVSIGVASLPLYGSMRLYKAYQRRKYFKVSLHQEALKDQDGAQGIQITYIEDFQDNIDTQL